LAAGFSQLGSLKCIIVYFGTAQAREWEIGPSMLIPRSNFALTRVGEYLGKQTLIPSTCIVLVTQIPYGSRISLSALFT
jgi:hypothetical protein